MSTAVEQLAVVPTTRWRTATVKHCVVFPDFVDTTRRYYLGPAGVTPDAVRRARAEFVTGQGWTVQLTLTRAGSRAWDALAEQQFHQQVAITASGKVVSAPIIQPNDATFAVVRRHRRDQRELQPQAGRGAGDPRPTPQRAVKFGPTPGPAAPIGR